MFDGRFIDPFDVTDPSSHLTNFATGFVTSTSMQNSMLDALDKGINGKNIHERKVYKD